jgi:hypothetical protein
MYETLIDISVIEAMAVCTPITPTAMVGGVVRRAFLPTEKADPLTLGSIVDEYKSRIVRGPQTTEQSEVLIPVWIVTARARELVRGICAPRTDDVIRIRGDSPVAGHDVVTSMVSLDGIPRAVVDVVFKQEDEVSATLLRGRIQRIGSHDGPVVRSVASQAHIRRGVGE